MTSGRRWAGRAGTALALLAGPAALAAPAAGDPAEAGLAEVIVTAQKRSESLQQVPMSVSVLGAQTLDNLNLHNLQDIAAHAPNVQMLASNGDAQLVLAMRGVAQSDYSPNGTPAVALYVDEVYLGATPLASGVQIFDVERVEMLFGPQGTLYGKNTTGGAVNLISVRPKLDGISGYAKASFGNYNEAHSEGALDVQLGDRWGTRFAYTGIHNDGYVRDRLPDTPNQSQLGQWAARWSLFYRGDAVDALLTLDKSGSKARHSGILIVEESSAGIGYTGYTRAASRLAFQESEAERVRDKELDLTGARLTVNARAGAYQLTSVTSLYQGGYFIPEDADGSPWKLLEDDVHARTTQSTEDLRLASNHGGPFNFIAGIYLSSDRTGASSRYRWLADAGDGTRPLPNACSDATGWFVGCYYANAFEQKRSSTAVYANTTTRFAADWQLTAGMRYTSDHIGVDHYRADAGQAANSFGVVTDGPPLAALQYHFIGDRSDSTNDSNVSGKLGLDWQAGERLLLYGSVSTGYRGSAYNGFAYQPVEFTRVAPEKLRAVEICFKDTFADGRARLNGAAFDYAYRNQQFLNFINGVQTLRNAGRSTIYGAELQGLWQATEHLQASVGLGVLHARYDELMLDGQNLAGNTLPSSPAASVNATVDYARALGGGLRLLAHYDGNYVARQYFEPFNDPRLHQGGYTLHNARLSLGFDGERQEVGLYGRNLLQKDYATYSVNIDSWNGLFFFRGLPRTFGLDYRYRF